METHIYSQLNTTTTEYFLNSDTFKGTEYMFRDNASQLYAVVCRVNGSQLDILQNMLLYGHDNGGSASTKYDYRIDLNNYIKVIHHDPKYFDYTTENSNVKRFDIEENASNIYLFISTANILSVNSSLLYEYQNGNYFFLLADFEAIIADKLKYNFNFNDISDYTSSYDTQIMEGGYAVFQIKSNITEESYSILNVTFRNSLGVYFPGYGFGYSIYNSTSKHRIILCKVPAGAKSIEFYINGEFKTVRMSGCVQNQYFYYGTTHKITSINCTGKREKNNSIIKNYVNNGRIRNVININKNVSYEQNVGFALEESKVFDISTTPFLIEFDFENWGQYTKWYIDNETFAGYNTKSISNRNFVLNLSNDKKEKRYTSANVNFFD